MGEIKRILYASSDQSDGTVMRRRRILRATDANVNAAKRGAPLTSALCIKDDVESL